MVPEGGFEPPRREARDFESPKSTSSITRALCTKSSCALVRRREVLRDGYQVSSREWGVQVGRMLWRV